jgi:SAM-dependent methyltransferase
MHEANRSAHTDEYLSTLEEMCGAKFSHSSALLLPAHAYYPDSWTRALLTGLERLDLRGRILLDVGVGPGTLAIALLARHPEIRLLLGSDIDGSLTKAAAHNASTILGRNDRRFLPCCGDLALLAWLPSLCPELSIEIAYSCLPQMRRAPAAASRADELSHYYRAELYPSEFNIYHLGLNDAFLKEASQVLAPGAQAVLVLAGRPGFDVITKLFRHNGFSPRVLHREIIQQDATTDLSQLVADEALLARRGRHFEFFGSAQADAPLTAAEAWRRMQAGQAVFHWLYAAAGTKGGFGPACG